MATYYSDKFDSSGNRKLQPRWEKGKTLSVTGVFQGTAALVANDVVQLVPIPTGAIIQGITVGVAGLDTGNNVTTSLGDGTTAARFVSNATVGRANVTTSYITNSNAVTPTVSSGTIATGLGYKYTADDTIDLTVTANAATSTTAPIISATVTYYCGEW